MMKKLIDIINDCCPLLDVEKGNFISEQGLDSFDIVSLIGEIEKNFSVKIKGSEIIPENFESIESISKLIARSGC